MTSTPTRPPLGTLPSSSKSFAGTPNRGALVSTRVSKLLASSSFRDAETIAALETLAEHNLVGTAVTHAALQEDLPSTSQARTQTLVRSNAAGAGVALKRQVDRRMADGAKGFLEAFSQVNAVSPNVKACLIC